MIKIRLILALLLFGMGASAQTNWNAFGLRYRVSGSDTTWYFPSNTVPVKNMSFYSRAQADGKFAPISPSGGYILANPSIRQSAFINIDGTMNAGKISTGALSTFLDNSQSDISGFIFTPKQIGTGTLPDEINSENMYLRHLGYEQIESNYTQLNTVIGANQKIIPRAALPAESLFTLTPEYNNTLNDTPTANSSVAFASNAGTEMYRYQLRRGFNNASVGKTNNMGNGDQFSVEPKTLVTLFIIKLVD